MNGEGGAERRRERRVGIKVRKERKVGERRE